MPLTQTPSAQLFSRDRFAVRASRLGLISRKFQFYDDAGNRIAFAKLSDSRVLSCIDVLNGTRLQAILWIRERVPSSPVTYDLFDSANGEKIGALRHCPWRSLFKNEWIILDRCDCELGRIRQNSSLAALLQQSLIFMPIKYGFYVGDSPVATCRQNANPLMPKLTFSFTVGSSKLDRRFAVLAAILLLEHRKLDE
jgi:hypothetical protein